MEYLTVGELKSELGYHSGEDTLNMELTGEWGSYRGYYEQVFIGYKRGGKNYSTVEELMDILYQVVGVGEVEGYKGGTFLVDDDSEVCFALDHRSTGGLYVKRVSNGFDGLRVEVEEED